MSYEIIANRFAPKRSDLLSESYSRSHSLCYGKCNFNCCFCDFKMRPASAYRSFDDEGFRKIVIDLLNKGRNFKFTGGEPTLNPHLERHLQIVKEYGGYIYLDSNGSNPNVLENLIKKNLINVLGISLKGITSEEAIEVAQINNVKLVWENVWNTLKIASQYSASMRTIVTLVFTKENYVERLQHFAELLRYTTDVYMKINNLQREDHPVSLNIHSADPDILLGEIQAFVRDNRQWKGRIIFVPSEQGVHDYNSLSFF